MGRQKIGVSYHQYKEMGQNRHIYTGKAPVQGIKNIEDLRLLLAFDRRGDSQARGQESGGTRHAQSKGREEELHDDEDGGGAVFWVWEGLLEKGGREGEGGEREGRERCFR